MTIVISLSASTLAVSAQETTGSVDLSDREAVAASYEAEMVAPLSLQPEWSGAAQNCTEGSASSAFDAATLGGINWFRNMAGLPSVTQSARLAAAARSTALMMEANNNISHYPARSWKCYSAVGAEFASKSNLTLGITGLQGVLGQIEDPGAWNSPLGHRRWLLFPRLDSVGIANTPQTSVIAVLGDFGARQTSTDWIAWPPAGYVPQEVIFPRWSLSLNSSRGADFSRAAVAMTKNGQAIDVKVLNVANGYGDNTLAWEPGDLATGSIDTSYQVTVSNILINGSAVTHSYEVRGFDRSTTPTCLGRQATIIGTDGPDVLRGTSGNDVIVGHGGDDEILGLGGDDIICAGNGRDQIEAGAGDDIVLGGHGNDALRGGSGDDVLNGQTGKDRLVGNAGADEMVGGPHRDVIHGSAGADVCWGYRKGRPTTLADKFHACERAS